MGRSVEVSVVLPAYNEEATLSATVETTLSTLDDFLPEGSFEVLVAEDGCDDRTPEIAAELAAADERVRHVHSDERLGRGRALEYAFREAEGRTLAYLDTDMATDMRHLEALIESIRTGGYDVATGSRWISGHEADRPAKRGVPSLGYNWLVRTFLRSPMRDHQCGFKAFDREALFDLLDDVEDEHWFWDTEVLVRAQRAGYDVREFPVDWTPMGDTKVDLVRDVFGMGSQIVRTWWQLSVQPRLTRRVSLLAGIALTVLAFALLFSAVDTSLLIAEVRAADLGLLAVATLVYALSWPVRGIRYRDILAEQGYREPLGFLTGAIFVSQTANIALPARAGDAIRAYIVKIRRGVPYPSGFASLATERVFDMLTITALAGTVLLGLAATGTIGELTSAIGGDAPAEAEESGRIGVYAAGFVGAAAIGLVAVIALSARSDSNYVRAGIERLSTDTYADYVAGVAERFVGEVQAVAGNGRAFARIGATSVVIWAIDALAAVFVLAAFGVDLSVAALVAVSFFAVSVGNLAKVLPLSPGGIGLYEGAFALIVVALTPIAPAVALGAALIDHAIKNLVTLVGGGLSMFTLNVSLQTLSEESEEAREAAGRAD